MRCFANCLALVLATLSFVARADAAELDAVQLRLREQYAAPLRWDNVKGPPLWIAGISTQRLALSRLHVVRLTPGTSTILMLPAESSLRIVSPGSTIARGDVEVWHSDGSGLYVEDRIAASEDRRSLIFSPRAIQPLLVRVTRPSQSRGPMTVSLFVSRREELKQTAAYRNVIPFTRPTVTIQSQQAKAGDDFYLLAAAVPRTCWITGPVRVAVQTRFRFPADESASTQTYRVVVALNGRLHTNLEYESVADSRGFPLVNGVLRSLGRREVGYFDIPPGRHQLTLTSGAAIYFRAKARSVVDYLVPQLNAPRRPPFDLIQGGEPLDDKHSPWDITATEIATFSTGSDAFVTAQERIALRSARDNRHRDGGLRAVMLMEQASQRHPDVSQISRIAEEIKNRHTRYRNLLPTRKPTSRRQRFAWFEARRLRDVDELELPILVAEQHVDDFVNRLSSGVFVNTGNTRESANVYRLPEHRADSFLRIAVDRTWLIQNRRLFVQFDNQTPIRLGAVASETLPESAFAVSSAAAGLVALHQLHNRLGHGTLGGPFSRTRIPAEQVNAALMELRLPGRVNEVRIWTADSPASDVSIALQLRSSRRFRLSESAFLSAVSRSRSPSQSQTSTSISELQNERVALNRFLQSRSRAFPSVPAPTDPIAAPLQTVSHTSRADLLARARRLTNERQFLPALQLWTRLLPNSVGNERRDILMRRVEMLQGLGETYLAGRQLLGLMTHDADAAVRDESARRLIDSYHRSHDNDALEQLQSAVVVGRPNNAAITMLAKTLVENGRHEFALQLALAVPENERPLEAILRAALNQRWWVVFERHRRLLNDKQRQHFW